MIPVMPQERNRADAAPADDAAEAQADAREAVCRRVGRQLALLAERLDPEAFAVLLKVMSGVNKALAQRDGHIDVALTSEERALLTPQLQREVVALLEAAGHPARVEVAGALPDGSAADSGDGSSAPSAPAAPSAQRAAAAGEFRTACPDS